MLSVLCKHSAFPKFSWVSFQENATFIKDFFNALLWKYKIILTLPFKCKNWRIVLVSLFSLTSIPTHFAECTWTLFIFGILSWNLEISPLINVFSLRWNSFTFFWSARRLLFRYWNRSFAASQYTSFQISNSRFHFFY